MKRMMEYVTETDEGAEPAAGAFPRRLADTLPQLSAAHQRLYASLWEQAHVPLAALELCRLRIAQLHRSKGELAREEVALAPALRGQLARWATSDEFDECMRACLAFTEVYAMDASAISDAQAQAVQAQVGDAGLVLLIEALGLFDGITRLNLLWQTPPEWQASEEQTNGH